MAEAALVMRDLQWQMVGGFGGDSHGFCLWPADLHPHKVGFFL